MATDQDNDGKLGGAMNAPVADVSLYLKIFGALVLLTVLSVALSFIDIDGLVVPGSVRGGVGVSFTISALFAASQAGLIIVFFMRLKDDARFNGLVLLAGLLVAGIFLVYTMSDTFHRHYEDPYQGALVNPSTGEQAPGGLVAIGGDCRVAANCTSNACAVAEGAEVGRCVAYRAP